MWPENEVTKQLQIRYPIIQAGMAGGVTTPELVACVSNEGGLGTIGAGYMSPESLEEAIYAVRRRTTAPFAVNVFIPEDPPRSRKEWEKANKRLQFYREELGIEDKPEYKLSTEKTRFDAQIQVIVKEKVPIISFTFGVPSESLVARLHEVGIIVIGTATTVLEAITNEQNGVDLVVAQGSEAGGHRGTFLHSYEHAMIGTMALVPQVVDLVQIPVIAAGGLMDGRGVLASLVLGARAVQLGTAFLTTKESGAKKAHQAAILAAKEEDIVLTRSFSGKLARGVENTFIREMKKYEDHVPPYPVQHYFTQPIRQQAAKQDRPDLMSLWSGQAPRLSQEQTVASLMKTIISDVGAICDRM